MKSRIDANQTDLVQSLRKMGASVYVTSSVGRGFPDIVVGHCGKNYLFEIKDPDKPPSRRVLTFHEKQFIQVWRGQVAVIHTIGDALEVLKFK